MAVRQHRETVVVPAARGTIVDRNGEALAIGRLTTTIYANPRQVDDARDLTLSAGKLLGSDPAELYPTLTDRSRGFVYVARKADPRKAEKLEKLGYAGLGFYPEELRYYPQGPVGAQILGYAGLDNKGLEGLERSLEGTLAGQPGSQTIVKDPFGRALDVVETKTETPGKDVRLTIDRQIQGNAEEVLAETVRRWSAKSATADRDGPADRRDPRHGDGTAVQREPVPDDACGQAPQPRGHRHLRARVDVQARDGCGGPAGGDRQRALVVPPAADPQGRRPDDPRVARTRDAANDRAGDRRVLLEHRNHHDRAAPRRGSARVVDRPLRLREEHGHRLPRRVCGIRAAARPVVGIDHRHRAHRPRHRGDARADGTRVLGDRERWQARAAASHRSDRRSRCLDEEREARRVAAGRRADALDAARRRRRGHGHGRPRFPDTPSPARREPPRRSSRAAATRRRATSRRSSASCRRRSPSSWSWSWSTSRAAASTAATSPRLRSARSRASTSSTSRFPQDAPKTAQRPTRLSHLLRFL